MRFSLLGVAAFMGCILVLALGVVQFYRSSSIQKGPSILIVALDSEDSAGLQEALQESKDPQISRIRERGVTFLNCHPTSSWPPATLASIFCGRLPSEHGLHPGHAHLTSEAQTLAEELARCVYSTYAALSRDSVLEAIGSMQGFSLIERSDPEETITSFLSYFGDLPDFRKCFAYLEVDLDPLGGPSALDTVLEVLLQGVGGDHFLDENIMLLIAPSTEQVGSYFGEACRAPMAAIMVGSPLQIGPGKVVLKAVSALDIRGTLLSLAHGQGFDIQDSMRTGKPVICEALVDYQKLTIAESVPPPPLFDRATRFDDNEWVYLTPYHGPAQFMDPLGYAGIPNPDPAEVMKYRYSMKMGGLEPIPDWNVCSPDLPVLDGKLAQSLGPAWNRPELMGCVLHAVEHFRLAEALRDTGYPALAIGELFLAISLDEHFPLARFTLAEVYHALDPVGGRRYFRDFLEKYGDLSDYAALAQRAREALEL